MQKTKVTKKKTKAENIDFKLDGETYNFLKAVVKLSNRDFDTVVNVIIASMLVGEQLKAKSKK